MLLHDINDILLLHLNLGVRVPWILTTHLVGKSQVKRLFCDLAALWARCYLSPTCTFLRNFHLCCSVTDSTWPLFVNRGALGPESSCISIKYSFRRAATWIVCTQLGLYEQTPLRLPGAVDLKIAKTSVRRASSVAGTSLDFER